MILPDLNLLLYAYNPHAAQHAKASTWWNEALAGDELVGLPYEICFGFVRIATNPKLGAAKVNLAEARAVVESWLTLPHVRILSPGANHFAAAIDLTAKAMGAGTLVSDAVLAAYAIEHRATLYSSDTDFARFADLDWKNPLL